MRRALLVAAPLAVLAIAYAATAWLADVLDALTDEGPNS